MNTIPERDVAARGTAVVSGAASGIGVTYADRLARRGYDLIVVARNGRRLESLAKRLTDETGRAIEVVAVDLNDKAGLDRIATLVGTDPNITMLVNNAGVVAAGSLLIPYVDKVDDVVGFNVRALIRLSYAAAAAFVARGGGTIINVASIVGAAPGVSNGAYSGTTAFLRTLTLSLHEELSERNVRIQAVLPSAVAVDIRRTPGSSIELPPGEKMMRADDMVDAALIGLDQGELITVPSLPGVPVWAACGMVRQELIPRRSLHVPASFEGARWGLVGPGEGRRTQFLRHG